MSDITRLIRIATLSGSARQENNTEKALALIHAELDRMEGVETLQILPRKLKLAVPGSVMDASDNAWLQEKLKNADGVILATPEYHGSFSSLMKLAIENMGYPSALKGKPVSLLGVAAGKIGAVKSLEHLRSVCSHVGALVLPGSVSIARVREVFDSLGRCSDPAIELEIQKIPQRLVKYVVDTTCPVRSFEEMTREDAVIS
jgi:FMN reductase